MTRQIQTALIGTVLSLSAGVATARAQGLPCPGPGNRARYGPDQSLFDPKTVQTVEGTVVAVERVAARGAWPGIHLRVKTPTETVEVHLGPAWFVDSGEIAFAVGDTVLVRASRVKRQGSPLLIAMTLTRGEMTLRLRDADGFPYWAGWRRRLAPRPGPGAGRGRPR
jgi:hypothetical protein